MTRVSSIRPLVSAAPARRPLAAAPVSAAAEAPKAPRADIEKDQLAAFETIIRDARYAVAVAGNTLKAKQSAHDAAALEFGEAVEAAKRLTGDNTALYQARVDRLQAYLNEAQTQLAHARVPGLAKAQTLEAEAGRLASELSQAQRQLTDTRGRIQWLKSDTIQQEARRDRAEREKRSAESDISRLESQVSPSKISYQQSRVRSAQWDVDSAASKVSSAQSAVSSLNSRISSIESEIRSLQSSTDPGAASKISSLRTELSGVKSRLSSAESTLSHARYVLSDAESDLRRERSELNRLEGLMRELEGARSRRSQAIREISAAETELAAHRRELPEQEALVPVTEQVIASKTADRAQLLSRAASLRGPKNAESHPQVVEARAAVANLQRELDLAKKTFETRTADPRAELKAAEQRFAAQMAPYRAAVTEAEQALKAAEAARDAQQDTLADLARQVGGWQKFTWRLTGFNLDEFMREQLKD